jgi:hypothetical protein
MEGEKRKSPPRVNWRAFDVFEEATLRTGRQSYSQPYFYRSLHSFTKTDLIFSILKHRCPNFPFIFTKSNNF